MSKIMVKHKIENLVVLEYASNACYTNVRTAQDVQKEMQEQVKKRLDVTNGYFDFAIDVNSGTWSWWQYKNIKIGSNRSTHDHKEGIIGVYDRTDTQHLSLMSHESGEAIREHTDHYDDL